MPTVTSLLAGRFAQVDEALATGYLTVQLRYVVGSPVGDPLALRNYQIPVPGIIIGSSVISVSPTGLTLNWSGVAAASLSRYQIERSIEPGFPGYSYRPVAVVGKGTLSYKDSVPWEGDDCQYRIWALLADGTRSLVATLRATHPSYGTWGGQLVITDAMTSASQVTVFSNLLLTSTETQAAVTIMTQHKIRFVNLAVRGPGHVFEPKPGFIDLEVIGFRCRGTPATTAHKANGRLIYSSYISHLRMVGGVFREMGGLFLNQFQPDGSPVPLIEGVLGIDIKMRRSNGAGGIYQNDWSSYNEDRDANGNPTGFTRTSDCNPPEPISWDITNFMQVLGSNSAVLVGGMKLRGCGVFQFPGNGVMEDAINLGGTGGQDDAHPLLIEGWLEDGNYSADWQWQKGVSTQYNFNGIPSASSGKVRGNPSMTGALLQDGIHTDVYAKNGHHVILRDAWLLGPGTMGSIQGGHHITLQRVKSLDTGTTPDGTPIVGYSRSGIDLYNLNGIKTLKAADTGQTIVSAISVIDTLSIGLNAQTSDANAMYVSLGADPALTSGNVQIHRAATDAEVAAARWEWMEWCYQQGIKVGPAI